MSETYVNHSSIILWLYQRENEKKKYKERNVLGNLYCGICNNAKSLLCYFVFPIVIHNSPKEQLNSRCSSAWNVCGQLFIIHFNTQRCFTSLDSAVLTKEVRLIKKKRKKLLLFFCHNLFKPFFFNFFFPFKETVWKSCTIAWNSRIYVAVWFSLAFIYIDKKWRKVFALLCVISHSIQSCYMITICGHF